MSCLLIFDYNEIHYFYIENLFTLILLNEVRIKCNKLNVYCLNVCWYRVDVCMCMCLLCVCVCNCMHAYMLYRHVLYSL